MHNELMFFHSMLCRSCGVRALMHYSVHFCRYELPGAEVLARYKQGIHTFLDMNVGMCSLVPRPEELGSSSSLGLGMRLGSTQILYDL